MNTDNKTADKKDFKKELESLASEFTKIKEETKKKIETKAYHEGDKDCSSPTDFYKILDDCVTQIYRDLWRSMDNISTRIDNLGSYFYQYQYDHSKGHVPPLTPSQLKTLVENVGADGDWEIVKRSVYAKQILGKITQVNTPRGVFVEAEYIPQKKSRVENWGVGFVNFRTAMVLKFFCLYCN